MQPSARSPAPTPRSVPYRSPSTQSIEVEHEISVISSRANSMKNSTGRPSISWSRPYASSAERARTSHGGRSPSPVVSPHRGTRSNSVSRLLSRSYSGGLGRAGADLDFAESIGDGNKESGSITEMAEFLRNKEPPPDNWISIPDEEVRSTKKSPFNIFGRRSSSRNRPKLMQLPDAAVAAKTIKGGVRHIAISIPLEYDHPEEISIPVPVSKFPPPVTVLKPVVEAREPISPYRKPSLEGKREGDSPEVPAAELLGPETAGTLKNYYTQLHRQHKLSAESNSSLKSGERSDNLQSDPRHSGGTVYSAVAISLQDHSQRFSSASTSPSVNIISVKGDMPRRNSSGPRVPKAIQTELAQNYQAPNFPSHQEPPRSSVLPDRTESLTSETSAYSFPAVAAEVARGYNNAAPTQLPNSQLLRPISQLPAPTRDLPDVPESPCIPAFLPSPSRRKITMGLIDDVTAPTNTDRFSSSSQSRQDRVKARKSRDMAAVRENRASRDTISDVRSTADTSRAPSPSSRPSTSPQPRKRRSASREQMRRNRNAISAIMLVADLAPRAGTGRLPTPNVARKPASQPALMARGTYTPPRSSLGSDSDMTPTVERSGFQAEFPAESAQAADQGLDSRRQERRIKRNMSLREKEMETRLRKVERDNAMLMTTLSGIAGSFGQLSSLLPQGRVGPEETLRPQGVVAEIQKLEPFMRELQAGAGRVSMEESPSPRFR